MSNEQSIRDDITRAVGGVLFNVMNFPEAVHTRLLGQDMKPLNDKLTDAILTSPVIRRIQAEAVREAAEEMNAGVSHLNPGNPTELSYINCTRIDAQELRYRADRIEKGSSHDRTNREADG